VKRESLFLYACDQADGSTNDSNIISRINNYFMTRKIVPIDPATGFYKDTTDYFQYHGKNPIGSDSILTTGNCRCGGWALFWADVINVHGYFATKFDIVCIDGASANLNAEDRDPFQFIVKPKASGEYNPVPNPAGGFSLQLLDDDPNYIGVDNNNDGKPDIGPLCQGGDNARHSLKLWPGHSFSTVTVDSIAYWADPSYGSPVIEGNLAQAATLLAGYIDTNGDFAWRPDGVHADIELNTQPNN
jgi:hypothetical protein